MVRDLTLSYESILLNNLEVFQKGIMIMCLLKKLFFNNLGQFILSGDFEVTKVPAVGFSSFWSGPGEYKAIF